MLDVQLKISWKRTKLGKTDLIDSLILPTILLQLNYILGECKSPQSNKLVPYTIPDI